MKKILLIFTMCCLAACAPGAHPLIRPAPKSSGDPIVGTWQTSKEFKFICYPNGTGVQRFDQKYFYDINKTYEGCEQGFRWEKKKPNIYKFYYVYKNGIKYDKEGKLEDGVLVFDQGDYQNRLRKIR